MGNRVLRYAAADAADGGVKFDNIFMAAADVDDEIFHENYIDNVQDCEDGRHHGCHIGRMLSKNRKSKIYCLTNGKDKALLVSKLTKRGNGRLGLVGVPKDDKLLHLDLRGKVANEHYGKK